MKAVDLAPPGAKCTVPPTEDCSWVAVPSPPNFVESQIVAGAHIISTRLSYYTEIDGQGSMQNKPVKKPVDLYRIPPGSQLHFGKHRVFGTVYANTPIMALADVKFDLARDRADQLAREKSLVLTARLKTATKAFGKSVEVVVEDSKPFSTGGFLSFFMDSFNIAILLFILTLSVSILAAIQFWSHCGRNVSLASALSTCHLFLITCPWQVRAWLSLGSQAEDMAWLVEEVKGMKAAQMAAQQPTASFVMDIPPSRRLQDNTQRFN